MWAVDREFLLQKFSGKGGWTYTEIPEIVQNPDNPFGWVTVSGFIDGYELKKYKLMPMGEGKLFLPVKAAIRKKIKKEAGDTIWVKLSIDTTPLEVPQEIYDCIELTNHELVKVFDLLEESEKEYHLDRIYEAKTDDTKEKRISNLIDFLSEKLT